MLTITSQTLDWSIVTNIMTGTGQIWSLLSGQCHDSDTMSQCLLNIASHTSHNVKVTIHIQNWAGTNIQKTRIKTIVLFEFDMKRGDFYEISTVSSEKERKNIVIIYQIN